VADAAELRQLGAYMRGAADLFARPTLTEKLSSAARALVEGGLFRRAAVRAYRQRFSARCLVAGAGWDEEGLERLRAQEDPDRWAIEASSRAIPVARNAYRLPARGERAHPSRWEAGDRLLAVLRTGLGGIMGDVHAEEPCVEAVDASSLHWLGAFLNLLSQVLEQDLRLRMDPLTRAFNASYLDAVLGRLSRGKVPFTAVFADMDGLKDINDRWGHLVGDLYIRAAHRILLATLPADGLLYRPYGDEFVYLREGDDPEPVVRAMERLPQEVEAWNARMQREGWSLCAPAPGVTWGPGQAPLLCISAGVAHGASGDAQSIVRQAEEVMYAHKAHAKSRRGLRAARLAPG
jgi:diguanylate cyclase (GGDEF)-like protein